MSTSRTNKPNGYEKTVNRMKKGYKDRLEVSRKLDMRYNDPVSHKL